MYTYAYYALKIPSCYVSLSPMQIWLTALVSGRFSIALEGFIFLFQKRNLLLCETAALRLFSFAEAFHLHLSTHFLARLAGCSLLLAVSWSLGLTFRLSGRRLPLLPFSVCCSWWPGALLSSFLQHLLSLPLLPLSLSCPLQEEVCFLCRAAISILWHLPCSSYGLYVASGPPVMDRFLLWPLQ